MRAILIATGWKQEMEALLAYRPTPLLNILGKPIAHHVMECLYNFGIRKCDILLHHQPLSIRKSLGNGSRWDMHIDYHLCKDAAVPFKTLSPVISGWADDVILLGSLDTMPEFTLTEAQQNAKLPTLVYTSAKEWTNWGVFPLSYLKQVPWNLTYSDIPLFFQNKHKTISGKTLISTDSYLAFMNSNLRQLKGRSPNIHLPTTSVEKDHGIWVSKGSQVHPSVKITPPVFIGGNTFIEQNAEVGPNVVIENNCIVDRKSKITNSLICKNSYIGEALTISNSLVDRNLLVNTNLNSEVPVIEDFILSEIKTTPLKHHIMNSIEKFFATTLLLLLFPIIAIVWPFSKLKSKKVVSIPCSSLTKERQTFDLLKWENSYIRKYPFLNTFISSIPLLINIIKGDLHFVGLPPREIHEINELPSTWRNLYLRSQAGIINLADLEHTDNDDIDQIFACEMYQTMNKTPLFTLRLITRWVTSNTLRE